MGTSIENIKTENFLSSSNLKEIKKIDTDLNRILTAMYINYFTFSDSKMMDYITTSHGLLSKIELILLKKINIVHPVAEIIPVVEPVVEEMIPLKIENTNKLYDTTNDFSKPINDIDKIDKSITETKVTKKSKFIVKSKK